MASVERCSPAAPRPLSLHVESPPSASPFPSPSSSFLPPPMPGAHEFAVKPPPRRRSAVSTSLSPDDGAATAVREPSSEPAAPLNSDALSPTTAQYRLSRISTTTTLEDPSTTASEPASASRRQSNSISSPTILNSPSLASSRPAPLSPAPSRRVSTISTRSSKSGNISRSNSRRESAGFPKRLSALSMTGTTATRKGDHDDDAVAVFDDEPLITPTVSASSMNLRSTPTTSSSSSSSPSTTTATATAIATPASLLPSSSTPTTTTPIQNPNSTTTVPSSSSSPMPHPHPLTPHRRPTSTKIKIRDFAYTSTDNRYRGMGSDVPKPNQFSRLNKKLGGPKKARPTSNRWSLYSSSKSPSSDEGGGKKKSKSANSKSKKSGRGRAVGKRSSNGWDHSDDDDDDDDDTSDEEEEEEYEEDEWFKRRIGMFSRSLGFPDSKKHTSDLNTPTSSHHNAPYPTRGEMDQNFGTTIEDETPSSESSEYYDAREDETSNQGEVDEQPDDPPEEEGIIEEEEEALYPGLYRALYPFEPEGTAEMRLVEDQIVRVVGRGGGVGWAVVVVPDGVDGGVVVITPVDDGDDDGGEEKKTIRHALVPESYLELVQLD